MISADEGLILYRSWGSGPWLMPRDLPPGVYPPCIVRREGELGIKIRSRIDLLGLFADREKPPRELRLTIVFRGKIRASTDFVPLVTDSETNPSSMTIAFDETFYLAVPYLDDGENDLGSLVFYLEEPSGQLYQSHQTRFRNQFQSATKWARGLKKEATKLFRSFAKKMVPPLRVAVCDRPLQLKASSFDDASSTTAMGSPVVESVVSFRRCSGGAEAQRILQHSEDQEDVEEDEDEMYSSVAPSYMLPVSSDPSDPLQQQQEQPAVGNLTIYTMYSRPRDFSTEPCNFTNNFAVRAETTPAPPVRSRRRKYNTIDHTKIVYDIWNGRDLFEQDGFCNNMFDVDSEYYEHDPLGPSTTSALEAPPVNIVRSIYGINVPTEVSAVYRKEPVVVIGDGKADRRYKIDKSAAFSKTTDAENVDDPRIAAMLEGYRLKDGIIEETPDCLQTVPGTTEKRKCCGDGTVPYWSLVHCLTWKDSVPVVTADELEGAVHRPILSDKRFHALLRKYCIVEDPRRMLTTR